MRSTAFLFALLFAGCSACDSRTVTERMRDEIAVESPQAVQYLIEAQRTYEQGLFNRTLALTDSVEKYAPDLADLHYLRGAVYTQLNQLEVAHLAYETVLELDPEYPGAYFHMGLNGFRRGKLRDAIDAYLQEKEIGETTGLYQELGRTYARLGEPDSARQAYERALALSDTNATAHMWLGQLLEETGDLEGALEASLRGLELRSDNLDYRYIIGTLYFRLERPEEALPYLEPVARELAWHHGAQFNLGQVYMRLGREDDARVYFDRADAAQQLQQKINEAEDAINRDPETLENWIDLGRLLRESGRLDRAIEAYKRAITYVPWHLPLHANLAILYMESGDTEQAIGRFEAILRNDPTMTEVWFNLGVAYANSGRTEEARHAWQTVLERQPGHATAREYLGRLPLSASESN